ncbi:MAG: IclR family transcriptional regulator [Clostridia bacterium]|nr:IclR family transcriptional regulator [Clostridia bacterium]
MDNKLAKSNQSLEKALQIIEFMADYRKPARLQDIAEALEYPASTVIRYLATLSACRYVKQDPETLRYSLTLKLSKIGNMVSAQYNIRDFVKPYLLELVEKTGESACLAIDEHHQAVYVDVESGPDNALRVMQRIGKEAPLYCTGVGKLLLLNYGRDELETIVREEGLVRLTHNTITDKEKLLSELEKVSNDGYAIDDEECELGARCVAAPIRDYTGRTVACISVSGPVSRMTLQKIPLVIAHTTEIAARISTELGFGNA